ncbi:MAG: hypothetical protein AABX17_02270 [Nanoarchaeota archaeon]
MASYKNSEKKKKELLKFLKNNPTATYSDIRNKTRIHPERLFKNLEEAYNAAGLPTPRTFKRKNKEERKKIIIDYLKDHPLAGGQTISKDTKINIFSVFKNTEEAFKAASLPYPRQEIIKLRKRTREDKIQEIVELIKKYPETTVEDIVNKLGINPFKLIDNLEELYRLAGMDYISGGQKRSLKKKKIIIEFIKNNPFATQREINKQCKTRIQGLFEKGIFGAYKEAKVEYPFERLNFHGSAIKEVKERAENFEAEIAKKLVCYGSVNRLVKTKRGVADIILERKGKKIVIEVKDYLNKEISEHEIKQLNKYLEDFNSDIGFLICHQKPKRDSFLMDKNRIIILEESELNKIPEILDSEM